MTNLDELIKWTDRHTAFVNLARDLEGTRNSVDEEPTHQDYSRAISLLRTLGEKRTPKEILETEIAPYFYEYFPEQEIADKNVPTHISDVLLALEEPYRAGKERKQKASDLFLYLAGRCQRECQRIFPNGDI